MNDVFKQEQRNVPHPFKLKLKHSRSHIYFHAKIKNVRCQLKGKGLCLGFRVAMDLMDLSHGQSITF